MKLKNVGFARFEGEEKDANIIYPDYCAILNSDGVMVGYAQGFKNVDGIIKCDMKLNDNYSNGAYELTGRFVEAIHKVTDGKKVMIGAQLECIKVLKKRLIK